MPGFSGYTEQKILNWFKGTTMGTPPAALYVGLFNGDPTDAGTGGTEVTTTIRALGRVVVTYGAVSGSPAAMSNSAAVDFGNAAGAATVTHFAVFDAATGGNQLFNAALTGGAQAVSQGNSVSFAAGQLVATVN